MRADTDSQILPHPEIYDFAGLGNGKVNNSIPVKPFGLKMKTFYIRGYCGAAWMGLDPSKFAIWRDRGVAKMDFWLAGNTEERILPHPGFGYFDRFGNGKVNNSWLKCVPFCLSRLSHPLQLHPPALVVA